jgi:hypothetical protein
MKTPLDAPINPQKKNTVIRVESAELFDFVCSEFILVFGFLVCFD